MTTAKSNPIISISKWSILNHPHLDCHSSKLKQQENAHKNIQIILENKLKYKVLLETDKTPFHKIVYFGQTKKLCKEVSLSSEELRLPWNGLGNHTFKALLLPHLAICRLKTALEQGLELGSQTLGSFES